MNNKFANQFYKELTEDEKSLMISNASEKYGDFLTALGIDWKNSDHTQKTPYRVAKMYVNELLAGRFNKCPDMTFFENPKASSGLILKGPISVKSLCSHHFMPFMGFCIIGIIPMNKDGEPVKIPGFSKYSRIVDWYSRRGQVQEGLGDDIVEHLKKETNASKIAVFMYCKHTCETHRGVNEEQNGACTLHMSTDFESDIQLKNEFMQYCTSKINSYNG